MAPRIFAVIHHRDDATSRANAAIAASAGCAGVFLIQMDGRDDDIDLPAFEIKRMYPELLVGTNRLMAHPCDAIKRDIELGLDASWCDNPGVRSENVSTLAHDIAFQVESVRTSRPDYLYFGSVAFKTQAPDPDPGRAAMIAADFGWVATTSGAATGIAPEVDKLAAMKAAVEDRPLAVASGVSPDNIDIIAPHVDWVLVATGISKTFYDFDADLLNELVQRANSSSKVLA